MPNFSIESTRIVEVDYGKSTAELLGAYKKADGGSKFWISDSIADGNFKRQRRQDKISTEVYLLKFDSNVFSADAFSSMEFERYRPALVEELYSLLIQYPALQKDFFLITLLEDGYRWVDQNKTTNILCAGMVESGRYLYYAYFDLIWPEEYRFLAVRK